MNCIKEYSPISNLNKDIWEWRGNILYYKNLRLTPILEIYKDGSIFLYIDTKNENQFSKILKILIKSPFEFYLVTNELNDPRVRSGKWVNLSIDSYFISFLDKKIYDSYEKLKWDAVDNLLMFVNKYGETENIWESYNYYLDTVDLQNYDFISNRYSYKLPLEIRENFKSLQRDIQIQLILK